MTVRPDWVCEITSPATAADDRTHERALYARAEVPHLWHLHPLDRTLEVLRLEKNGWLLLGSFEGSQRVRAEPFDAVEIDLGLIWPDVPPDPDEE